MHARSFAQPSVESILRAGDYQNTQEGPGKGEETKFVIAISREAGAKGLLVAEQLGKELGWTVYDKQLLDAIANEMGAHPGALKAIDERPMGWLEETLQNLLTRENVSDLKYLKYLIATVRGLGGMGHCIIVGRGANFILPPKTTLSVRLVADLKDRIVSLAERNNLDEKAAADLADRLERERTRYVKGHFHKDPADPHFYDLLINTSLVTVEEAAHTIISLLRQKEHPHRAAK